ncbi:Na(+)/H(+) antiporter subunit D [Dasania sp. GY-MA-18]|uniref:Na(+)/H(+) antiporter subunit D n=1 Tax=Dasania phycosphaerae TaxID=2950436 RepID=A0A9J6RP56_9GAMM|nr:MULTISPECIES: Na(+)/H(+) antiporter subunit D [Dasania]MCR8923897.1 Na(+)/H(+) antiporter subunit D [Dasania sp. GY-MA-18]MCZ0866331.1 Na(+)/H(+) antiporter subunit D [Dasania phycosphaerae]MCZ0870055.1 Na(+)/H(+) antiporter subunit D [Dasania phycosphaerae]
MAELPAFVPFFIAALLAALSRGVLRATIMLVVPIIGAIQLYLLPETVTVQVVFFDYQLMPYRVDKLSLMFGYLFHLAALIAIIYSLHVRDTLQQVVALLYAGSALGAVFAGDLLTLFVFWECLAFSSVFLIWAGRTQRAYAAGMRYLLVQVLSGLLLLAGAVFYVHDKGTLQFTYLGLQGAAGWLIFIALGIKCAFPMLHNWLTDAYPEATVTGTVLLSAFTTKVAIYALARGYPGTELLVYIGAAMTCFPIFFAVIENDLRRVLAYSMINQLGFMVVGIGIGTALAVNGAIAHAFNDVIFKGLLFMAMGAVLQMTGRINGSDLGGLYKTMPKTTLLCIIGAASISAFPLFSGFVSKSMVMVAALENNFNGVWLLLLFASAGVFHHAGIKIPYFAFFAHDAGLRVSDPPNNMLLAMLIAAVLCIAIGVYPAALYALLPYELAYSPYDATHILTQTQLLFFSALAFVWLNLRGYYPPELRAINLDTDWFYRRFFAAVIVSVFARLTRLDRAIRRHVMAVVYRCLNLLARSNNEGGVLFSRSRPIGSMVMWVAVLLAAYLFISFVEHF